MSVNIGHRLYSLAGRMEIVIFNGIERTASLRQFVKQKRKELKLTQEHLAINAGIGFRFVRDLEQGRKRYVWTR